MIYHIDLLLDEERRSASPLHVRMLLRLGAVLAVAGLLLATMLLFLASRDAHARLEMAEANWSQVSPKHQTLLTQRAALIDLRGAMRQLDACHHARLAWGAELTDLQGGIPGEVQLTGLRVSSFVGSQTTQHVHAARSYEMHVLGKTGGEDAEAHVKRILAFLSSADHTGRVESVTVSTGGFRPDPSRGAARSDRLFEIVCRYRPRSFE